MVFNLDPLGTNNFQNFIEYILDLLAKVHILFAETFVLLA